MPIRLALAASARDWSDRLHRSVLDHGGGTVVGRVMSADQAVEMAFDVLLIDDVCSYLTPRLVYELRRGGKAIVGVFSPDDGADGKRRLLEVGIGDVAESDATADELLSVARASVSAAPVTVDPEEPSSSPGKLIGVIGPPGGVGVTEVAIGLAGALALRHRVGLIDLNQSWPSVAQRLGLRVHPNLRTAVDFATHEPDRLAEAMHIEGELHVVTGLANPDAGELATSDIAGLLVGMSREFTHTVVDLGTVESKPSQLLLRRFDALLLVGLGDPIGIGRAVRALQSIAQPTEQPEIGIVLNRVGGSSRQRGEISTQVAMLAPGVPLVIVGEDDRLASSVWLGRPHAKGPFRRQMKRLASLFDGGG